MNQATKEEALPTQHPRFIYSPHQSHITAGNPKDDKNKDGWEM